MSTVCLIYNTILAGKWYSAGDPIEKSILPANLHKHIAKPHRETKTTERNLMLRYNQRYSVDDDGFLKPSFGEQAAQLEAVASEEEAIADELAEAEVSETVASAVEEAREDYRADVERQKVQASAKARQQEEADQFIRQEQDEQVESGEFDQWDADSRREAPRRPPAARAPAKAKSDLKAKRNSYVRRGSTFVPASTVKLVEGENLYWYRKRKFGQTEKFILFGRVERRKEN